jgi:hypothetical protein
VLTSPDLSRSVIFKALDRHVSANRTEEDVFPDDDDPLNCVAGALTGGRCGQMRTHCRYTLV